MSLFLYAKFLITLYGNQRGLVFIRYEKRLLNGVFDAFYSGEDFEHGKATQHLPQQSISG